MPSNLEELNISNSSGLSNPVIDAIIERRSTRQYTEEAIRREELLAILEAGRLAPSGRNLQPCRFLPIFRGEPEQDALANFTRYSKVVRDAQLLIAVFLERSAMYDAVKDYQGAGASIQNMLLAGHSLGIGGLWIGEILAQEPAVMKTLNLPEADYQFMALVCFGRSDDSRSRPPRHPLSTFLLKSI